ncbi:hypothetical protein HCB39_26045 [Salinispora arenicola]|nr:hypothetical protein [Salinispora arenicola]
MTTYAEKLFGKTPRCIAYIRARGSEENQDRGLLALGQRPFRPRDLATQVITPAGKLQAVENERKFRQDLDASESQLASKKADHQLQYQREEQELRDIKARRTSRGLLQDAAGSWQLYLTLGTLVANNHSEDLFHEITKLESDIEDKKKRNCKRGRPALKPAVARRPFSSTRQRTESSWRSRASRRRPSKRVRQ